jgi:hypothetical protein
MSEEHELAEPTAADDLASKLRIHKIQGEIYALKTMLLCLLATLRGKAIIQSEDIELLISTSETTLADAYQRTTHKVSPQGTDYINDVKAAGDAMLQSLRLQLSETDDPQSSV